MYKNSFGLGIDGSIIEDMHPVTEISISVRVSLPTIVAEFGIDTDQE
jgi:hypothetical protein